MHIMLDLETLSTRSDAAIVAIGARTMFTKQARSFYRPITLNSAVRNGHVDGDTLAWWFRQSDQARELFNDAAAVPLPIALSDFSSWLAVNEEVYVWGNGAAFDNVVLSNAYQKMMLHKPWSFRNDRCYRTIKSLYPDVEMVSTGVKHNALNDATSQAMHLEVIAAMKGLRVDG